MGGGTFLFFFSTHIRDGFLGKRQERDLVKFHKELLFVGLTLPFYYNDASFLYIARREREKERERKRERERERK